MADIAKLSPSRLRASLQSAKSSLSRIRAGAEEAAKRGVIFGTAAGGGYATGWLRGRAQRDNKSIGFGGPAGATGFQPDATPYTLVGGLALGLGGALMPSLLGETLSNVAMGAGAGMVAGDLAFMGQKQGLKVAA